MAKSIIKIIEKAVVDLARNDIPVRVSKQVPFLLLPSDALPIQFREPVGDELISVVLDCETTGLDAEKDKIIELGLVRFTFSPSDFLITSIEATYSGFEDPQEPLSETIKEITKLTDEDLAGQQFDAKEISELLSDASLVVAHNAKFDRPFFDNRFSQFSHLHWGCSMAEINWRAEGFSSNALEFINFKLGYYYEAHRATTDCYATLWAVLCTNGALEALYTNSKQHSVIYRALGFPYEKRQILKDFKFIWQDGAEHPKGQKYWYIIVDMVRDLEVKSLLDSVSEYGSIRASRQIIEARDKYSNRMPKF